jgi:hypothetical protein
LCIEKTHHAALESKRSLAATFLVITYLFEVVSRHAVNQIAIGIDACLPGFFLGDELVGIFFVPDLESPDLNGLAMFFPNSWF